MNVLQKYKKKKKKMQQNVKSLLLGIISGLFVLFMLLFIFHNKKKINNLNNFIITAYCPGSCCNHQWAGKVVDGHTMDYYLNKGENIIAADLLLFPLGTKIIWNNIEYTVRDTGSAIKNNRLDILLLTHQDTIQFGIKYNQKIKIKE